LVRDNPGRPVPEETFTRSHPSWSTYFLYHLSPFATVHGIILEQPLSRSSLVFPLVLNPQLHTPCISSPNHLFAAHAHTNAACELHWLKVPERIQFRLCVLAYSCLIGTVPSYLAETLHSTADVGSRRRLRSASKSTLVIPTTRHTTLGDRAFSVTAARAWNALPSSVCSAPSLLQFRRDLKMALFQSSYSSP